MKTLPILIVAILLASPGRAQSPPPPSGAASAARAPWGAQIAGNYSRAQAMADYVALQKKFSAILAPRPPMIVAGKMAGGGLGSFYQVRVPANTRAEAEDVCKELRAAGGACVVMKS